MERVWLHEDEQPELMVHEMEFKDANADVPADGFANDVVFPLFRCMGCGAVVAEKQQRLHVIWHESMLKLMGYPKGKRDASSRTSS